MTKAWTNFWRISAAAITSASLVLWSVPALADCSNPQAWPMERDGKKGAWFAEEPARCLLLLNIQAPLVEKKLADVSEKSEELRAKNADLQRALDLSDQESDAAHAVIQHQNEELEAASAWYRSPWLWVIVGGAVGVTGTVLVGSAL